MSIKIDQIFGGDNAIRLDYLTLDEYQSPDSLMDSGTIYAKDMDGYTELFYFDSYGNSIQITNKGVVLSTAYGATWDYLSTDNLPTGAAAPEAVWQFDGTADSLNDRTGNGHDLTAEGTLRYSAAGGLQGVYSRDSLKFSIADPTNMKTQGAFTAVFLVSLEADSSVFINCSGDTTGETEATNVQYRLKSLTDSFEAFYEYGLGANELMIFDARAVNGPVQYLCFTRSSDGLTYKVYVDGHLLDTQVATNAPTGGTENLTTYLLGNDSLYDFFGSMFSALFTKEEWTAAQVLESYNNIRLDPITASGLSYSDIDGYALKTLLDSYAVFEDGYLKLPVAEDPTSYEDDGYLYSKEIDGYAELHYMDDYGLITQITSKGAALGSGGSGLSYSDIDGYALKSLLDSYATEDVVDGYALTSSLSTYAEKTLLDSYAVFEDGYLKLPVVEDPTSYEDDGYLYSKEIDGYAELHYMDDYGLITQITNQGSVSNNTLWRYLSPANLPTGAAAPEGVWQGDSLLDQTANGHNLTVTGGTARYCVSEGLKGWWAVNDFYLDIASPASLVSTGAVTFACLASFHYVDAINILFGVGRTDSEAEENNRTSYFMIDSFAFKYLAEYGAGTNIYDTFDALPVYGPLQHVVFTRSSDGLTYKVYADGVLLDTSVAGNAPSGGAGGSISGEIMGQLDNNSRFNGAMFSALFSKEEWSAAQVLENYQYCRKLS